jgi:hypothetical protein
VRRQRNIPHRVYLRPSCVLRKGGCVFERVRRQLFCVSDCLSPVSAQTPNRRFVFTAFNQARGGGDSVRGPLT